MESSSEDEPDFTDLKHPATGESDTDSDIENDYMSSKSRTLASKSMNLDAAIREPVVSPAEGSACTVLSSILLLAIDRVHRSDLS
jgi:hypothetical protein